MSPSGAKGSWEFLEVPGACTFATQVLRILLHLSQSGREVWPELSSFPTPPL